MSDQVGSAATRMDMMEASGAGFGAALSGQAGVLRKKDATPAKATPPQDGPPSGEEEPDWDEIAMLEQEAMEAEAYASAAPAKNENVGGEFPDYGDEQEMPDDIFDDEDGREASKRPLEESARQNADDYGGADAFMFDDAPPALAAPAPKRPKIVVDTRVYVHRIEPVGDTIAVTGGEGSRVFLKAFEKATGSQGAHLRDSNSQFTVLPIEQMVAEAQQELHNKEVQAAVAEDMQKEGAEPEEPQATPARRTQAGALWVDKYRPRKFTELISDGKTNRNVLRWLTTWQTFIDGKGKAKPKAKLKMQFATKSEGDTKAPAAPAERKPWEEVPPDATDEDGRPVMKLLLLAGPPGLGKVCPTAGAASILQQ